MGVVVVVSVGVRGRAGLVIPAQSVHPVPLVQLQSMAVLPANAVVVVRAQATALLRRVGVAIIVVCNVARTIVCIVARVLLWIVVIVVECYARYAMSAHVVLQQVVDKVQLRSVSCVLQK